MGLMYAQGLGVNKDHAKAAEWFQKAARGGHVLAAYNLAFRCLKGEGVSQDFKTAAAWFRRAAGAGLPQAQHTLGLLGEGVPQNSVRAYMWLALSAKQKNRIALKDREAIARQMTAKQIQEAEALVNKWRRD
jgi:TPR repeat protein